MPMMLMTQIKDMVKSDLRKKGINLISFTVVKS